MDNYITILPNSCINFNHIIKTFCLPEKTLCDHTIVDGIFTECDNQWNCNKMCQLDHDYFINIPSNGNFMLQTNFNTTKNPTQGWGDIINAKLFTLDGTMISADHTEFSSHYMVGHTGKYGFQNIELSGSLISQLGVYCFYIQIEYQDITICTHHFRIAECNDIVELESYCSEYDCWNNYYKPSSYGFVGSSNFAYSNKIYLKGKYKYFGSNVNTERVIENIRLYPGELIAPFMERYISHKILKSKKVIIDGELWDNKDNVLTPRERSSMFFPILEFEKESCTSSNKCS